jgi:hypothetical protein
MAEFNRREPTPKAPRRQFHPANGGRAHKANGSFRVTGNPEVVPGLSGNR